MNRLSSACVVLGFAGLALVAMSLSANASDKKAPEAKEAKATFVSYGKVEGKKGSQNQAVFKVDDKEMKFTIKDKDDDTAVNKDLVKILTGLKANDSVTIKYQDHGRYQKLTDVVVPAAAPKAPEGGDKK